MFGPDSSVGFYLALAAPFIAAGFAPVLHRFFGHRAAWILAIAPAFIFAHFLAYFFETPTTDGVLPSIAGGGVFLFELSWVPALGVGLDFLVDGLSHTFALLISGIGFFIVLYAGGYLKGHEHLGRFFSFILMFMGAMVGLVLADDIITLFIYWELTSITSFLLIGFNHAVERSRRAAIQALVVTGGGGLALLAGLLLMASFTGTLSLSEMATQAPAIKASALYLPILLLVLGGCFTKSAQFPFHFWLPNAMEAPTPVSAYLHSATMVKAGVYLLMRLNPTLGDTVLWSTILPIFGCVTLLVGAILAIRQTDLKQMLAYTTVASLGLLVALTGTSAEAILLGGVLYLCAHALFKAALFMVAGTIYHEAGTLDVTKLGGLRSAMPITAIAALLAALSMGGLPPFIGFLAKEYMYKGAAYPDLQSILLTGSLVLGNSMMFAAGFAVALRPFYGEKKQTPKAAHEGPLMMWSGPVTLAILSLVGGLLAQTTGAVFIAPLLTAVAGFPAEADIKLWEGFNIAVVLSIVTIVLGTLCYVFLDRLRDAIAAVLAAIGWGPDKGFDQAIGGLVRLSDRATRVMQFGEMKGYMTVTFLLIAVALLAPLVFAGEWPTITELPDFSTITFYELAVVGFALLGIVAVMIAKNRLTAVVSLGIQGFAVALIFTLFGAPDLAFTQFMVETLSVVILALVLTRMSLFQRDHRSFGRSMLDGAIAVGCGVGFTALLLRVVAEPFDPRLSEFFTAFSYPVAQGRNIVNVILVDYRGVDTLGEIGVVVIAGLAVLALVRLKPKSVRPAMMDPAVLAEEAKPHDGAPASRPKRAVPEPAE
ncbi:MAG: putative monovalent cation/H+ antiporter subunit A [Pseudomonadota bacterium]